MEGGSIASGKDKHANGISPWDHIPRDQSITAKMTEK